MVSYLDAQEIISFNITFNLYAADDENYPVNVSAIELIPDPLKRPDMMAFKLVLLSISAAGEAISRGKWVMKAEYFGLVVQEEIRNLCEEVSCPVTAGNVVLTCTRKLSSFTPTVGFNLINKRS
ncbi:hypothetical protein RIF29_27451 [Crotalaria pallida]|uniref:MD-2-related lipid-recognition domain-containing protein n=1 Tax=Crotalaria pallida TaxID=3830 RepID=A0AAN9EPL3_CROPI